MLLRETKPQVWQEARDNGQPWWLSQTLQTTRQRSGKGWHCTPCELLHPLLFKHRNQGRSSWPKSSSCPVLCLWPVAHSYPLLTGIGCRTSSVCLLPLPLPLSPSVAHVKHMYYTHMYMCNPIPDHSRNMDTRDTHRDRHDYQQPCATPPVLHSLQSCTHIYTDTHTCTHTHECRHICTHTHFTPFLLYLS